MPARNALKASRGYTFVRKGRGAILMKDDGTGSGVSFSCGCKTIGSGTGSCKVVIEPAGDTISCEKSTCGGVCKWEVNLPGLSNARLSLRIER